MSDEYWVLNTEYSSLSTQYPPEVRDEGFDTPSSQLLAPSSSP